MTCPASGRDGRDDPSMNVCTYNPPPYNALSPPGSVSQVAREVIGVQGGLVVIDSKNLLVFKAWGAIIGEAGGIFVGNEVPLVSFLWSVYLLGPHRFDEMVRENNHGRSIIRILCHMLYAFLSDGLGILGKEACAPALADLMRNIVQSGLCNHSPLCQENEKRHKKLTQWLVITGKNLPSCCKGKMWNILQPYISIIHGFSKSLSAPYFASYYLYKYACALFNLWNDIRQRDVEEMEALNVLIGILDTLQNVLKQEQSEHALQRCKFIKNCVVFRVILHVLVQFGYCCKTEEGQEEWKKNIEIEKEEGGGEADDHPDPEHPNIPSPIGPEYQPLLIKAIKVKWEDPALLKNWIGEVSKARGKEGEFNPEEQEELVTLFLQGPELSELGDSSRQLEDLLEKFRKEGWSPEIEKITASYPFASPVMEKIKTLFDVASLHEKERTCCSPRTSKTGGGQQFRMQLTGRHELATTCGDTRQTSQQSQQTILPPPCRQSDGEGERSGRTGCCFARFACVLKC